ncbi:Uncharacterised protein [Vibrio cholerae]|nr:Uncharacterised protein [Vibrio cholerae]
MHNHFNAIGNQHFQNTTECRFRQRMSIFANKDWASHTMFMAHIRYRLRNRKNMMLIKGSFIGRTSVSRRTKFNFMRRIASFRLE